MAQAAVAELELEQVRFLPCRQSPHKTGSSPTSAAHRMAMLELATATLPWAVVDDFELQAPPPSYSVLTAEEMARRFPQARLFWLMGTDQWEALPRWREPERLAELVEFAVFPRGRTPQPREGFRLHRIDVRHPASATAIRAATAGIFRNEWLLPAVARYIEEHGLYSES